MSMIAAGLPFPERLAAHDFALRAAEPADAPFLRHLYGLGRAAEMAWTGWPAPIVDRFLDDQYRLRALHYRTHHPQADALILTAKAKPIGRLLLDRADADWHIVDIAILPEAQGQGRGGALLRRIRAEAKRDGAQRLILQVARDNGRAEALYRRLGFVDAGDPAAAAGTTSHLTLVWPIS